MNIPHPRSDRSSVEFRSAGAFIASEDIAATAIDIRDYPGGCAVWLLPTGLGSVTSLTVTAYASDDGTTVPVVAGGARVPSDDTISDGLFTAFPYRATFSTADGTLTANKACGPFRIPQVAGALKIAVTADGSGGSYTMRAQRLS